MGKPRIMYFNDDRHTLAYMYEPPMQKEEWDSAVDELVGTPVEALMFCLGDGRTVMHDSKVGELLGENQDRWENLVVRRAHQNPKHLIEEGNGPAEDHHRARPCQRTAALSYVHSPVWHV